MTETEAPLLIEIRPPKERKRRRNLKKIEKQKKTENPGYYPMCLPSNAVPFCIIFICIIPFIVSSFRIQKNSLSTRGARLLNFLIAYEEPIVKVNTLSPYTFRKYCRTEKQILVSTICRRNILLMYSISNDLFDGPPSTSQLELLEGSSNMFFKIVYDAV